jgi:hypothetical protein
LKVWFVQPSPPTEERMTDPAKSPPDLPRHPIGTMAIVGVYGLLFVLGWLAFYFLLFRARGAVTP